MFEFVDKHYASRPHEKMRDVLMNPDAPGPAVHYHMIRGGKEQRNITVWEPGTVGGEYIKTYGHYHVGNMDETYQMLLGEGVALLQLRALDATGQPVADILEEFRVVRVRAGDSLYMPPNYGHLLVNIGKTYFVTADDSPVNFGDMDPVSFPGHADYEPIERMHGFAYYVIEKGGEPALVANKNYREVRRADFAGLPVVRE